MSRIPQSHTLRHVAGVCAHRDAVPRMRSSIEGRARGALQLAGPALIVRVKQRRSVAELAAACPVMQDQAEKH